MVGDMSPQMNWYWIFCSINGCACSSQRGRNHSLTLIVKVFVSAALVSPCFVVVAGAVLGLFTEPFSEPLMGVGAPHSSVACGPSLSS